METTQKRQQNTVKLAQQGDKTAQQTLALQIQPAIHSHLMMLTKNQDLAQDLTQESLMKIFSALNQLREPKAFKQWAMRIATNELRKHIKKSKAQNAVSFSIMDDYQLDKALSTNKISPATLLENQETTNAIKNALSNLKASTQDIFRLRLFEKLSYQQISTKLNCTETMARTAYFRAKKALRTQIEAQPA